MTRSIEELHELASRRANGTPSADAERFASRMTLLSAIRDGTITLDEVRPDAREALLDELGESLVADMLETDHEDRWVETSAAEVGASHLVLHRTEDETVTTLQPAPQSIRLSVPRWAPIAALLVLTSAIAIGLIVTRPSTPPFHVAVTDKALPTMTPEHLQPGSPVLSELPDFEKGDLLGGPSRDEYLQWRLRTVIVVVSGGAGSGAIVAPGYILTNYHVVASAVQNAALAPDLAPTVEIITGMVKGEGDQQRITRRPGGLQAVVVRARPEVDLALLRLEETPPWLDAIGHFELGTSVGNGDTIFALGSAGRGLAWGMQPSTVVRYRVPEDLFQHSVGGNELAGFRDRYRGNVLTSQAQTAPGYSGGPVLNEAGELVGLNFGAVADPMSAQPALHVPLEYLREFLAMPLDAVSPCPFDVWMGGPLHFDHRFGPIPEDVNGDGTVNRVAMELVNRRGGGSAPSRAARVEFIDLDPEVAMSQFQGDRPALPIPYGLWGFHAPDGFRFDVFIHAQPDGLVVVGFTDASGVVDEIRVAHQGDPVSDLVWSRQVDGSWQGTAAERPMTGSDRLTETQVSELMSVWGN